MNCPKCKHEVYYQVMYSGSMYRCPECDWLGTHWQTTHANKFSWQPWALVAMGSAVIALTIAILLRDWGMV